MLGENENTLLLKVMASVDTYVNTFRLNMLSSDEFIWIFSFPKYSISVFCVNSVQLLLMILPTLWKYTVGTSLFLYYTIFLYLLVSVK